MYIFVFIYVYIYIYIYTYIYFVCTDASINMYTYTVKTQKLASHRRPSLHLCEQGFVTYRWER